MIVIKKIPLASACFNPYTNTYFQDNLHFLFIDFHRDPFGFVMRLIHDQYVWGLDFFSPFFFHSCCNVGPRALSLVNIYNDSWELSPL